MKAGNDWIGSVWSHRSGRVVIGRLRALRGTQATLSVVGLGVVVPEGARLLPPDEGGGTLIELPIRVLEATWKRMGLASAAS